MLYYFLLIIFTLFVGQGLIAILNFKQKIIISINSFLTTFVFWVLLIGITLTFRLPLKTMVIPIGIASLSLCSIGILRTNFETLNLKIILLYILLPLIILWEFFYFGFTEHPGSTLMDGWSYLAYGQYLYDLPRGQEGGLAPIYQFAAHLAGTRFISCGFLGMFAGFFFKGKLFSSIGLFLGWSLFIWICSLDFFAQKLNLKAKEKLLFICITVLSGWTVNILFANNYDNLLALSMLPLIFGLAIKPEKVLDFILLGIVIAASIYTYPEMMTFVCMGLGIIFIQSLFFSQDKKRYLLGFLTSLIISLIVISPFLNEIINFLQHQLIAGLNNRPRPGEGMFAKLINLNTFFAAFWGLPIFSNKILLVRLVPLTFGIILFIFFVFGIKRFISEKKYHLASFIILLFLIFSLMIFKYEYSYGAYKIILISWWLTCFTATTGLFSENPFRSVFLKFNLKLENTAFVILALFFMIASRGYFYNTPIKSLNPFAELININQIVDNEVVSVNITNTLNNIWAIYFLKDTKIVARQFAGYMAQAHVLPYMKRSTTYDSAPKFILTDDKTFKGKSLAWENSIYVLWHL